MPYLSVTRAIEVHVEPRFIAEQSKPEENRFFWAYRVRIRNLGQEIVQLRSRYWKITDANGLVSEVRGTGVIGEQPILKPAERYEYTSGCPLDTPSGIMAGSYQMQNADGELFNVEIPAFSLDSPYAKRVLN